MVRRTGGSWSGYVHVQRNTALRFVALISLGCAHVVAQSNPADEIARLGALFAADPNVDQRAALLTAAGEQFWAVLGPEVEFESANAAHERWWDSVRPHAELRDVWDHQFAWSDQLRLWGLHDQACRELDVLAATPGLSPNHIVDVQVAALHEAVGLNDHADILHRCDAIREEWLAQLDPAHASATRVQIALFRNSVFLAQGLTDRALAVMEQARAECTCEEDLELRDTVHVALCNVYLATEQFERIEQLLSVEVLERLRSTDPSIHGTALVRLGTARSEMARTKRTRGDDAVAVLVEALPYVANLPHELAHSRLLLADLALRGGDPQRALEVLDEVGAMPSNDLEQNVRRAAFRVWAALDLQVERAALQKELDGLEQRLFEFVASWRQKPVRDGGVGFLHWGSQRLAFSTWIRAQLHLDGSRDGVERALAPILEAHELASAARSLSGTSSFEELRAGMVAPGRGVLVYMPGPERCHVFCIDDGDPTAHELQDRDVLRTRARTLDREWTARPDGDADEKARRQRKLQDAAREAHNAFLPAEVYARIATWREVIVVGADLAGEPSFEVFALEPGRWLGLEKAFVYSNSTALALALDRRARERESSFERDVTLIGAPLAAPRAGGSANKRSLIVLSEQDVDGLLAGFDPDACDVRLRERASVASLREPSVGNSGVLTLFAHGVFEPGACEGDERSAIVLLTPGDFDDGVLCCSALEGMDLPPLVELLSCGAARGPLRFGDGGASHLVGASFIGGARAVLASRFEIGVDASLAFMRPLHTALRRDGASPMVALLEARQSLASDPATADPWYWASLTLHGAAWRPIFAPASLAPTMSNDARSSSSGWKLATIVTLVLAAVVSIATWMRRRSR